MNNFSGYKQKLVNDYGRLFANSRELLSSLSQNNKIEFLSNGVIVVVNDPFDNDVSEVDYIVDGMINLNNGTEANVENYNLTDLINIIQAISE